MNKNLNLIHFSPTGTTAKIVKAIAEGMDGKIHEWDLTLPGNRQMDLHFDENDIVIVGAPVYAGRVPAFLTDTFSRIKGNNTAAVFIAVYGNRDYEDALLELKDTFERNGFIGIAGGAFIGEHSYTEKVATGRPDADDLKIARDFGEKILKKLITIDDINKRLELFVKGNFPYKDGMPEFPVTPITNNQCTNCGICAEHCPMGAISFTNCSEVDESKCIICSSCVKRCPVKAKSIDHEIINKIRQNLIDNCSNIRKEPELFFLEQQ